MPRLVPTVPVHEHCWPIALVHLAVAVDPTLRQVIAAEAVEDAAKRNVNVVSVILKFEWQVKEVWQA